MRRTAKMIDTERLRRDLMNFLGTARRNHPAIMIEIFEVEQASSEELLNIAQEYGFDLDKYIG